jgi:hypothetical protein
MRKPKPDRALLERLFSRTIRGPGGCWLWTGGKSDGYAMLRVQGRMVRLHRTVYEQLVGPVPSGLEIDHLCRVRCCLNPEHMEPVAKRVNILRGEGACAVHARKVTCVRGHPLSGENLEIEGGKFRRCKQCRRDGQMRRWRERRVALDGN